MTYSSRSKLVQGRDAAPLEAALPDGPESGLYRFASRFFGKSVAGGLFDATDQEQAKYEDVCWWQTCSSNYCSATSGLPTCETGFPVSYTLQYRICCTNYNPQFCYDTMRVINVRYVPNGWCCTGHGEEISEVCWDARAP
jgi:hypothetical protein